MGLKSDKAILKAQLRTIEAQESEIGSYNRKVNELISEIRDNIVSDNVENLVDAVEMLLDAPGANGNDSNLNSAKMRIKNEIAVIQAAIDAQEAAARAMQNAAK